MAIDSKGNNHQPKGMPDAGKFAPKAGAGDDDDLWYKPRYLVGAGGTAWGGRYVPKAGAGDGDMAAFRRSMTVEPSVMGDRDYGEAAVEGDLGRDDTRMELPGCMAVGKGWTLDPLSVSAANNQCRFTDDEGGMLETQDDDWFDPNLGDCSSRRAKYTSPRGDKVVAYDMKVETEGRADISAYTPDGLKRAVARAKRALGERTGIEPERVEVRLGTKPGAPMRVRADYPMLEPPDGFHPFREQTVRRENLRRREMGNDWVEVEP